MTEAYTSDHDLLVSMHTTLGHVQSDVKELKENTQYRLAELETKKLDRTEFDKLNREGSAFHKEREERWKKLTDDHENRIRSLETKAWIGLGAILVIEPVVTAIIVKYLI